MSPQLRRPLTPNTYYCHALVQKNIPSKLPHTSAHPSQLWNVNTIKSKSFYSIDQTWNMTQRMAAPKQSKFLILCKYEKDLRSEVKLPMLIIAGGYLKCHRELTINTFVHVIQFQIIKQVDTPPMRSYQLFRYYHRGPWLVLSKGQKVSWGHNGSKMSK